VVSSARRLISLAGLAGLLTHWPFLDSLATALIAAKTKISRRLKQAAAFGVATVRSSATEIANAASIYYLITSSFNMHSLMREKTWWWLALARKNLCWWLASFGESYHGDVLQYAKHLFSLRFPQMTKYCVMRECDNIHSWISSAVTQHLVISMEFTVLNSPKGFWRSLPEISLFSQS